MVNPWFGAPEIGALRASILAGRMRVIKPPACLIAGLAVILAAAVPAANTATRQRKNIVHQTIWKTEESTFTGTVVANDSANKLLTVQGHQPFRKETVQRVTSAGQTSKAGNKPPKVTEAKQTFKVDTFCHIMLTNNLTGKLSDMKEGDQVDVEFRKQGDGSRLATAIKAAGPHPDDPPPSAPAAKPKKKK